MVGKGHISCLIVWPGNASQVGRVDKVIFWKKLHKNCSKRLSPGDEIPHFDVFLCASLRTPFSKSDFVNSPKLGRITFLSPKNIENWIRQNRYIPCAGSHAVRCAKMFRERERWWTQPQKRSDYTERQPALARQQAIIRIAGIMILALAVRHWTGRPS